MARIATARSTTFYLIVTVAIAWLVSVAAELTGTSILLHHHTLLHGPPLVVAVPAFLGAWQVMVAAMMLPASATTIATYGEAMRGRAASHHGVARFVLSYFGVWTLFGL